jgi:large repetitive protein
MHTRIGPNGALTRNRILAFGGSHGQWGSQNANVPSTPLSLVQEWDDAPSVNKWTVKNPLFQARVFQNAVLLPNRTVFIVGGVRQDHHNLLQPAAAPSITTFCEIYDPGDGANQCGSGVTVPQSYRPRSYHSFALLLPDGRVMVGGGEDIPAYPRSRDSFEIYSPAYMFSPRPVITQPPSPTYAASSSMSVKATTTTSNPATFKAVLMRPGVVTHHFDSEQRYLELAITQATPDPQNPTVWNLTIGPVDGPTFAPPGYYMFFFAEAGIPSTAAVVQVL